MSTPADSRMERALLSLEGLSLGDALGERFMGVRGEVLSRIEARTLPSGPWRYTDDTEMALAVVETMSRHGRIDPDALATRFAERYRDDPNRGYGGGAHTILKAIGNGESWKAAAGRAFNGQGSRGNGAAMRVAPLGAYFADDLDRVVGEATASAAVTHASADGQAGAVAVAIAAAWVCTPALREAPLGMLAFVHGQTPASETRDRLERAVGLEKEWAKRGLPPFPVQEAARVLGNGSQVCSADTVPFALWSAARNLDSFEDAFWDTVSALGDCDTTSAIACGIVALGVGRTGLPAEWLRAREPLALSI